LVHADAEEEAYQPARHEAQAERPVEALYLPVAHASQPWLKVMPTWARAPKMASTVLL
jgi:hypothetical protein